MSGRPFARFVSISVMMMIVGSEAGFADSPTVVVKHVMVYHEAGRFGGWPANHGIWSWDNEILVGFSRGYYKDLDDERHNIDREKPEDHLLARSLDGGETWVIENPSEKGVLVPQGEALHGVPVPGLVIPKPTECLGDIDFSDSDFAMTLRMFSLEKGQSQFFYSYDRGRNWEGPFRLPAMGTPGISARTSYIINGKNDCTAFLSTTNMPEGAGNRSFCARTTDGGKTWNFESWIGPPPEGFAIMPAAARVSETEILCILRRRNGPKRWITSYLSPDNGRSWEAIGNPVDDLGEGNPASLIRLRDGGMCLTYGYRAEPFSICAKLSSDGGRSWSDQIVLRDDCGNRDLGYPRSIQRPDGKVVTVYYSWDKKTGPERYIAATIWDPHMVTK